MKQTKANDIAEACKLYHAHQHALNVNIWFDIHRRTAREMVRTSPHSQRAGILAAYNINPVDPNVGLN